MGTWLEKRPGGKVFQSREPGKKKIKSKHGKKTRSSETGELEN